MDSDEKKTEFLIQIRANGSYHVLGGVPLIRRVPAMSTFGEPLEWDPVGAAEEETRVESEYKLCRCGHSANKPFCDDSHHQANFNGTLSPDRRRSADRRKEFPGSGIVMSDDPILCADAGFCGTRFTKVWDMINRTDDPEVRARLLRMVQNCPSGRLVVRLDSGEPIEPEYRPSIAVVPDGPLWVRGGIPIQAPDGYIYEIRNRVTLCRCGQSRNKPFCDGTHEMIKFKAP